MTGGPDPQLLADRFGLGRPTAFTGPVARGEQGEVWRLDTRARSYAVKTTVPSFAAVITPARAEQILDFQTTAARRGVPVPGAHRTTAGAASTLIGEIPVRLYDWVDLDDPDPGLDPGRVGALLAAVHRTRLAPDGPCDPWFTEPVGRGWDDLLAEAVAAVAPFADRLAVYRDDLLRLEATYTPMSPVQLCHLDLWADNLRTTAGGELCVIDWDNCGSGDPDRELAFCLVEFARRDPRRATRLMRAYRDADGPGRVRGPADFTMVAAVFGHLGQLWMRRWLDTHSSPGAGTDPDRARVLRGIDEFFTDPLTPEIVERLLDAVTPLR